VREERLKTAEQDAREAALAASKKAKAKGMSEKVKSH
jgi:hypothetical protein